MWVGRLAGQLDLCNSVYISRQAAYVCYKQQTTIPVWHNYFCHVELIISSIMLCLLIAFRRGIGHGHWPIPCHSQRVGPITHYFFAIYIYIYIHIYVEGDIERGREGGSERGIHMCISWGPIHIENVRVYIYIHQDSEREREVQIPTHNIAYPICIWYTST